MERTPTRSPMRDDPRREAALRLAIAEARYHRALHKVDTHDREPNSAQQVANKLLADVRLVLDGMPRKISEGPADPFDLEYAEFSVRQLEWLMVEVGRRVQALPQVPRRGAGAAQEAWLGAPSMVTKTKIPETNSKYNRKENIAPNSEY